MNIKVSIHVLCHQELLSARYVKLQGHVYWVYLKCLNKFQECVPNTKTRKNVHISICLRTRSF